MSKFQKLSKITLDSFTKFKLSEKDFEFSEGINVFLGKNGTGKTHLLKLIYAITKTNLEFSKKKLIPHSNLISERLFNTYKISKLSQLIRNNKVDSDFTINYSYFPKQDSFYVQYSPQTGIKTEVPSDEIFHPEEVFYFPTRELLTNYLEFVMLYEKYDDRSDETQYNLAKSLNIPKLKNKTEFIQSMLDKIREHIGGELIKENSTFYIENSNGKIESTMLAEGIKKLATLQYLIENGSITESSILIWDEPELYLNPKMITIMSSLLNELALKGVQIFLSTHDYLLSHQLSLMDEYRDTIKDVVPMKFFCLEDSEEDGIIVYTGKNLTEIPNNPILEEFSNHYDREQELFKRSLSNE